MKKIIKWVLILALFAACQYYAYTQRGYYAVGGEIFIIAVPLWIAIGKGIFKYCCKKYERL